MSVVTQKKQDGQASAIDRLLNCTAIDMAKVNDLILSRAQSHVAMVPELARYLIDSGGKRLRPMLVVAAAALFGSSKDTAINFAAAVEFMHNATLLHDDVVDDSDMRRGRPAARMIWGNQASVLVGDFLLGQAFMMMVETRDVDALGILAAAAAAMAEGEVLQLSKTGDLTTSATEYAAVIRAKTATLFEAACEVGAMAGGADAAGRLALRTYGLELGNAFQLVDDVLDYRGEAGTIGKNCGDDLREGKMTLPVILALAEGSVEEQAIITQALGDAEASAETVRAVVEIMERYNTLTRTLDQAHIHAQAAVKALSGLPSSDLQTLLGEVVQFSVSRAY